MHPHIVGLVVVASASFAIGCSSGDPSRPPPLGNQDSPQTPLVGSAPSSGGSGGGAAPSATGGIATVMGTLGGQTLVVGDAIGVIGTQSVSGQTVAAAALLVTSFPNACEVLTAGQRGGSIPGTETDLEVAVFGASTSPVVAGTYAVAPNNTAGSAIALELAVSNCEPAGGNVFQTGSVVLTTATSETLAGSFNIMSPAGNLTGTFTVPICSIDLNAMSTPANCS
jgi:hypothetical protein